MNMHRREFLNSTFVINYLLVHNLCNLTACACIYLFKKLNKSVISRSKMSVSPKSVSSKSNNKKKSTLCCLFPRDDSFNAKE